MKNFENRVVLSWLMERLDGIEPEKANEVYENFAQGFFENVHSDDERLDKIGRMMVKAVVENNLADFCVSVCGADIKTLLESAEILSDKDWREILYEAKHAAAYTLVSVIRGDVSINYFKTLSSAQDHMWKEAISFSNVNSDLREKKYLDSESIFFSPFEIVAKDGGNRWKISPMPDELISSISEDTVFENLKNPSFLVHNIKWDTDGENPETLGLPETVKIDIDASNEHLFNFDDLESNADEISNILSDIYGFCHKGFTFEFVN